MSRKQPGRRSAAPARPVSVEHLEDRKLMSTVVALTGADTLLFVDSAAPDRTLAKLRVRGLQRREALVGIDFRPATGQLYGVGATDRLYSIDLTTGQATPASATGAVFAPGLEAGVDFGVDFNPRADRLRITADNDINFRIDPSTGATVDSDTVTAGTQADQRLSYVVGDPNVGIDPTIVAVGYDRNVLTNQPGAATTLFGIDTGLNTLIRVGSESGTPDSPNGGQVATIGPLGVDPIAIAGFDIETTGADQATNTAYASIATAERGRSSLYTVNLDTGAATSLGEIRGSRGPVRDIAVVPAGNRVVAVDAKNRLYTFSSTTPTIVNSRVRITGLARSERVLAIDVRPANNTVYAYTTQNRLYTLDPATGAATSVGTPTTGITLGRRETAAIDFNPRVDRLRVVTSANQNLRLDPTTGAVVDGNATTADTQGDANVAYAAGDPNAAVTPQIFSVGYTNNFVSTVTTPAPTTTLYGIDTGTDSLVTIGSADGTTVSPNTGQAFTVGALGVDVRDVSALDIATTNVAVNTTTGAQEGTNAAVAAFRERRGGFGLYSIDLATGAATRLGNLGRGVAPVSFAVLPA